MSFSLKPVAALAYSSLSPSLLVTPVVLHANSLRNTRSYTLFSLTTRPQMAVVCSPVVAPPIAASSGFLTVALLKKPITYLGLALWRALGSSAVNVSALISAAFAHGL